MPKASGVEKWLYSMPITNLIYKKKDFQIRNDEDLNYNEDDDDPQFLTVTEFIDSCTFESVHISSSAHLPLGR